MTATSYFVFHNSRLPCGRIRQPSPGDHRRGRHAMVRHGRSAPDIGWPWRYICGGLWPADWPPSIGITAPVTNAEAGEHTHRTPSATSDVCPVLRIGVD